MEFLLLFAGTRKDYNGRLTDAQIMERARKMGMMTKEEINDYKMDKSLDNAKESLNASSSPEPAKKIDTSSSPKPVRKKEKTNEEVKPSGKSKKLESKKKSKKKERKTVPIKIESGMVSKAVARYLYQKGVVGSASDFNDYLLEHEVTKKLRAGNFDIPVDASYEEIVEIIT